MLDKTTVGERSQARGDKQCPKVSNTAPLIQVPIITTYRHGDSLVNVATSSAVLVPNYGIAFEITGVNITVLSSAELFLPNFVFDGNRSDTLSTLGLPGRSLSSRNPIRAFSNQNEHLRNLNSKQQNCKLRTNSQPTISLQVSRAPTIVRDTVINRVTSSMARAAARTRRSKKAATEHIVYSKQFDIPYFAHMQLDPERFPRGQFLTIGLLM
jgi:hypothetical protein